MREERNRISTLHAGSTFRGGGCWTGRGEDRREVVRSEAPRRLLLPELGPVRGLGRGDGDPGPPTPPPISPARRLSAAFRTPLPPAPMGPPLAPQLRGPPSGEELPAPTAQSLAPTRASGRRASDHAGRVWGGCRAGRERPLSSARGVAPPGRARRLLAPTPPCRVLKGAARPAGLCPCGREGHAGGRGAGGAGPPIPSATPGAKFRSGLPLPCWWPGGGPPSSPWARGLLRPPCLAQMHCRAGVHSWGQGPGFQQLRVGGGLWERE